MDKWKGKRKKQKQTQTQTTPRAETSKCVRYNGNDGLVTKLNRTNLRNELSKEMYYYSVKCVEGGSRGLSPTSVAENYEEFEKFLEVSKGLKVEPRPEGFESFTYEKKREAVKKLADKFLKKLEEAMGLMRGADIQSDFSHNMQVGTGCPSQSNMNIREGVDMQVENHGQIQFDEAGAAAPNPELGLTFLNDTSLQNVAWNQCDNSQGIPPSRTPVSLKEFVFMMNDLMLRASRFPGISPKFEWSEEAFWSFVVQLKLLEGGIEDGPTTNSRSRQEEVFPPLPDLSANEVVTSTPSMEGSLGDEFWNNLLTTSGRLEAPSVYQSLADEIWSNLLTSPSRP